MMLVVVALLTLAVAALTAVFAHWFWGEFRKGYDDRIVENRIAREQSRARARRDAGVQ